MKKLSICGNGRHGKDETALMFSEVCGLRYIAGTSYWARFIVFDKMMEDGIVYRDAEHCWNDRHNHRIRWANYIQKHNQDNPIRLYQECLENQDILTGIRFKHEFEACKKARLADIWIWVWRPNFPLDSTCQITEGDCDYTIVNDGTKTDLCNKVTDLAKKIGILR